MASTWPAIDYWLRLKRHWLSGLNVSAKRLRQVPEEYAGCFSTLERAGLIPADLSIRLQQMARFRNLLVHVYWKIDYGQVYDVITNRLNDLRAFRAAIVALI